jgi:hypothetical protein
VLPRFRERQQGPEHAALLGYLQHDVDRHAAVPLPAR